MTHNKISVNNTPIYTVFLSCGLGNRLFQFATGYGVSKNYNVDFKLYINLCNRNSHSDDIYYNRFFSDFYANGELKNPVWIREPVFSLNKFFIPKLDTNVVLRGYFQTDKYFKEYRNDLLNIIKPTNEEIKYIMDKYGDLTNVMFIHVRMGDYLKEKMHFIDFNKYYKECLSQCESDTRFIVLTDNMDQCLELYSFLGKYEFGIESEIISLFLMSMCNRGGICANSSFSWWGSWLNTNPDKKIFMPNLWFSDLDYTNTDIHPDGTIVISV